MTKEEWHQRDQLAEVIRNIDNVLELLPYINLTSINKKKANKKLNKLRDKINELRED